MTPLATVLVRRIEADGPISIADYMVECLLHPTHGYYTTRDPFGAAGDFTTAPEISQIFGEMLGVCLAQVWSDQGRPDPFLLVELGPGRGTLIADVLRTICAVPRMAAAARVHLIEASPMLRERQAVALGTTPAEWHDTVTDLPEGPLYLLANEFFDALPIRQFVRAGPGWRERQVGIADSALGWGLAPATAIGALDHRLSDTADGDLVEVSPALAAIAGDIARRIARHGGVALVADYGGWRSRGDTLQAIRHHAFADPLDAPGDADLTAHVDFEALSRTFRAAGASATAMTPQGVFLERLGITRRAQDLAARLTGPDLAAHVAAHRRLTHPDEMGQLFKLIACHPAATKPPPGLEPD